MAPDLVAGATAEAAVANREPADAVAARQPIALRENTAGPASVDLTASRCSEQERSVVVKIWLVDRDPVHVPGPTINVDCISACVEDPEPTQRDILRSRVDSDRRVSDKRAGAGIAEAGVQRCRRRCHLSIDRQITEARLGPAEVEHAPASGQSTLALQYRFRATVTDERDVRRDRQIQHRIGAPRQIENAAAGGA